MLPMHTKIQSDWLGSIQYASLSHPERYAVLTSLIRASACGWITRNPGQLFLDTGLTIEVLESAFKNMGLSAMAFPQGWWLPKFILEQVGNGDALANNPMRCSVCRAIRLLDDYPDIVSAILKRYPELKPSYEELSKTGKIDTSRSPRKSATPITKSPPKPAKQETEDPY